ncbi:Atu2307/SP_0267 family LLM class monooxygenase [Loktanella agnita]|uniref:Atu2307/SP_0267 family LLM class monooxygenase n=1 Tax=Loktanella agnita TaxID=287097 RepID=UPI00398942EA
MEIGIDSFAAFLPEMDNRSPAGAVQRMENLLAEIETADLVGLDSFGVGEHHRAEFLDASPAIILAAAAARTKNIRLNSAVTVLSAADPVRVFQDFATIDLITNGRAEIVAGRGSFAEAYPLFGFAREDYDALFAEKLGLLMQLNEETHVTWQGRFRPALTGQGVFPRPVQEKLPIWLGVGGTPGSFSRAGSLGLPLMIAIIGGSFERFRPLVDLYYAAGAQAGHSREDLKISIHAIGFVAETDNAARDAFYPGWERMFRKIGRERGFPPPSRAQFNALCGPDGAFLVGSPATVRDKVIAADATMGGISRITFQMSTAALETEQMQKSITLLGTEVAPAVRGIIRSEPD